MIKSKNMEQKINVHWSWWVRITTIVVTVALLGLLNYSLNKFMIDNDDYEVLLISATIFILYGVFMINAPISVRLTTQYFELKKVVGSIRIEYAAISYIGRYTPTLSDMKMFGSGGLWGFVGVFRNSDIGSYNAFIGDMQQSFLIRTVEGRVYVFSVEDVDDLIASIKRVIR